VNVCISLCTTVVHNTAVNSSDNVPSYPPDIRHSSDVVNCRDAQVKVNSSNHWAWRKHKINRTHL